jgi:hypothetical protein
MYNIVMKFIKKNSYKLVLFVYVFFTSFNTLYAKTGGTGSAGTLDDPLGGNYTIPTFIQTILEGVLKIGMPVIALAIIYCGFLFVKAQGKPEEITKAKEALTWTLVGAAILLGAWALAKMISATVLAL